MTNLLAIILAEYLIWLFPVILLGLGLSRNRLVVYRSIFTTALAWFITIAFKNLFFLPRPYVTYQFDPLVGILLDGTFPSGHSTASFAIAFSIFWQFRRLGLVALVFAVLVGVGRVLVGVHYPVDVLVGLVVGFTSSLVVKKFIKTSI